jgi:hypothetical protein
MLREREREGGSHACGLRCGEYGGLRGRQSGSGGGGRGGGAREGWVDLQEAVDFYNGGGGNCFKCLTRRDPDRRRRSALGACK